MRDHRGVESPAEATAKADRRPLWVAALVVLTWLLVYLAIRAVTADDGTLAMVLMVGAAVPAVAAVVLLVPVLRSDTRPPSSRADDLRPPPSPDAGG